MAIERNSVVAGAITSAVVVDTNVATATVPEGHGFTAGMLVALAGTTVTTASAVVTSVTATTVVFPLVTGDATLADGIGTLSELAHAGSIFNLRPGHKQITFFISAAGGALTWLPYAIEEGTGTRVGLTTARTLAANLGDIYVYAGSFSRVQVDVTCTNGVRVTYTVSVNTDGD